MSFGNFGHRQEDNDEPEELGNLDEKQVRKVAKEMKKSYKQRKKKGFLGDGEDRHARPAYKREKFSPRDYRI